VATQGYRHPALGVDVIFIRFLNIAIWGGAKIFSDVVGIATALDLFTLLYAQDSTARHQRDVGQSFLQTIVTCTKTVQYLRSNKGII